MKPSLYAAVAFVLAFAIPRALNFLRRFRA